MTLNSVLAILKTNLVFIAILTVVAALVAYSSTSFLKSGYSTSQTYFIKVEKISQLEENSLDVNALTDTSVALLSGPGFQNSVGQGNVSTSAKKVAPQVVTITTNANNPSSPNFAQESAALNFNGQIKDLIKTHNVELVKTHNNQQTVKNAVDRKVTTAAGAVLGFATAIAVISMARYFKV